MRNRQHLRQLSKSELAETTRALAAERETLLASQARRWTRALKLVAILAMTWGILLGICVEYFVDRHRDALDRVVRRAHVLAVDVTARTAGPAPSSSGQPKR